MLLSVSSSHSSQIATGFSFTGQNTMELRYDLTTKLWVDEFGNYLARDAAINDFDEKNDLLRAIYENGIVSKTTNTNHRD